MRDGKKYGEERAAKMAATEASASEVKPPAVDSASLSSAELSNRDRLAGVVIALEKEIKGCDEFVPRNHVAALYGQLGNAIGRLSKLDGDGELSIGMVLRSRAWLEIQGVLLATLSRHPVVAAEVADALDGLKART